MWESIELQNMGESFNQTPSRVNTTTVILSLRMIIISVVILTVIVGTILSICIYMIHDEKLKQMDAKISTLNLADLVNDLLHEYEEKMNQNISHSIFVDTNTLLQLHNSTKNQTLKIYDEVEKSFPEKGDKTVSIYRTTLIKKMDKSFAAITHEQTFRRVESEDWKLSKKTQEQIKELYDKEFQKAVTNYTGRDPPEISAEFHEHVAELTLSKAVALKTVVPYPTVFIQLQETLWAKYNKELEGHAVIGIDFGESYIRSFVYVNGQLQKCDKFNDYVGLEEFDSYSEPGLKLAAKKKPNEPLLIFYDLKEIIRAWNSFNQSSKELRWTFNVRKGRGYDGPSVSSSSTGVQHSVESIVAKLFRRVREGNGVGRCVITVPFDFTKYQRNLIFEASNTAGFQEVTLLDEDIAAALTFQYVDGPWNATKNIMFLEFNQLAWKIYILEGHQSNFTRVASAVYDLTPDVVNICVEEFCSQVQCDREFFKYDESFEVRIRWRRFYEECETAILQVTENTTAKFYYTIFRDEEWFPFGIWGNVIEEAIQKPLKDFTRFIDSVLGQRRVNLTKEKIDEVILGGKYGNLSVVKNTIGGYFKGRDLTINGVSPVDTIAYGAAVKGLQLAAAAIKRSRVNETNEHDY